MTVSAGVGGGTVVGVVLSGSGAAGGNVLTQLPHTGASHVLLLLALAIFLVVSGVLTTGMARHRHPLTAAPGAPGDDSASG